MIFMNKSGNADDPSLYYIESFYITKEFHVDPYTNSDRMHTDAQALQGLKGESGK